LSRTRENAVNRSKSRGLSLFLRRNAPDTPDEFEAGVSAWLRVVDAFGQFANTKPPWVH